MEPFQKTWSDLYWVSLENSGIFMYVMCYAIYYKPLDYMIVDSSSEIKDMSSAQSLLDSWYDNVDKCLWHKQRVFNLDLDTKCRVDLQDDKYSDVDSFPVSLVQSAFDTIMAPIASQPQPLLREKYQQSVELAAWRWKRHLEK